MLCFCMTTFVLQPLNIGALVSERLSALRKLQENPNDVEALQKMYKAQKEVWWSILCKVFQLHLPVNHVIMGGAQMN